MKILSKKKKEQRRISRKRKEKKNSRMSRSSNKRRENLSNKNSDIYELLRVGEVVNYCIKRGWSSS